MSVRVHLRPWRFLCVPPAELLLRHTVPVGQSFRWRKRSVEKLSAPIPTLFNGTAAPSTTDDQVLDAALDAAGQLGTPKRGGVGIRAPSAPAAMLAADLDPLCFAGVIGARIVEVVQIPEMGSQWTKDSTPMHKKMEAGGVLFRCHGPDADHGAGDAAAICDYFNLAVPTKGADADVVVPACEPCSLVASGEKWREGDERYAAVAPYVVGARVLRQPPLECLFSFICSSNNNIERITGMVNTLCRLYGKPLGRIYDGDEDEWFTFPTLDALREKVTEDDLRSNSFGYRAKYIVKAASELHDLGGEPYLLSLRDHGGSHAAMQTRSTAADTEGQPQSYEEVLTALTQLTGVGRKVSACVCLFALDQHCAIPVDTHVWQIAVAHYDATLEGKTLTPRVDAAVQGIFYDKFGAYCGWAHNALFLAELHWKMKELPEEVRTPTPQKKKRRLSDAGGGGGRTPPPPPKSPPPPPPPANKKGKKM
ncbi:N-glycosylase/DNA lyase [Pycnococcus provasolii]